MDNCRMNYTSCRSCRTLGRDRYADGNCECSAKPPLQESRISKSCGCSDRVEDTGIYALADRLPDTMAYVPSQKFTCSFELCKALQVGTIFPELCKPFCGRRGCR